mmetsp:Transcript_11487/g.11504  ORF Transcript_11487/g.11504 Transcript_11487/m.11504 type:complete len:102 (+) Transcript_11487:102-407(+)|eukprot:CAMPEP_0182427098 /NCGR_PEP_ID=MMETSP1167-20130531/14630_1 /TAXON_ID=2988 /ORGANISM="Mallomonas Sp, Strain CCMP3275" /LENGTH=101 /DNA_ID=CAMNT_0024609031 /DNA_START=60 /DNA_END=365 /DNA_ORIENTATION=-
MSSEENDKASNGGSSVEPKDDSLTISVKDSSGEEIHFKVKKDTKFEKVFAAVAQKKGVVLGNLRFTFDGKRLTGDHTPKMLEMEDGDQIDSFIEQQGGANF